MGVNLDFAVSDEMLKEKFSLEDSNYQDAYPLDEYQRDVLRDTGPAKLVHEYEYQPKVNELSKRKLTLREHGRRYENEPAHHDLLIHDKPLKNIPNGGPDWVQFKKQIRKHKNDVKYGFKSESAPAIATGVMSKQAEIIRNENVKRAKINNPPNIFENTKERFVVGVIEPKHSSRIDTIENSEPVGLNTENYNQVRRFDVVADISSLLPMAHRSVTDHRIKIADYNKIYKQNPKAVDIIQNMYNAEGTQKPIEEWKQQEIKKQLELFVGNIKRDKKHKMQSQDVKFGKENMTDVRSVNTSIFRGNQDFKKQKSSEKVKAFVNLLSKNMSRKIIPPSTSKLTDIRTDSSTKGLKNNDLLNMVKKVIDNRNMKSAVNNIIETHNKKKINNYDGQYKFYSNNIRTENKSRINDAIVNAKFGNSKHTPKYSSVVPDNPPDKVYQYGKDFDHYALSNTENKNIKYTTNKMHNPILQQSDIKLDNHFGDNKSLDRHSGNLGSKYLFNKTAPIELHGTETYDIKSNVRKSYVPKSFKTM